MFEKKRDQQSKRRDFAEILCFIYIIFIFQSKSAKHIQIVKKKISLNLETTCKHEKKSVKH